MIRPVLVILGSVFLIVGIFGIFLPGLPTTPFFLLTAGFYARSSDKLYQRLVSNKHIGPRILAYQKNKGLTLKEKLYAISFMWLMIILSIFIVEGMTLRIVLAALGIIGTIVMGALLPTIDKIEMNK